MKINHPLEEVCPDILDKYHSELKDICYSENFDMQKVNEIANKLTIWQESYVSFIESQINPQEIKQKILY